jgi:type IV pilus assembly protein PilE
VRRRGFTLLELLAVVAIVAILASVAVPAWRGVMARAGRLDATGSLMEVGMAQERHRFVRNSYAATTHDPPPDGLGFYTSERGWYVLSIVRADETTFLAEARPARGSPQENDPLCQVFTIDETGRRGSAPGSVDECWP